MKMVRKFTVVFGRVVFLTALMAGAIATSGAAAPVKNIALVHGAFADGSSWSKVVSILQDQGYNVTAVQIPLTSFHDDVAATRRALARLQGPVILVGHSWAGVVITEAGADSKVAGLVYVAAFAPDKGENVGDLGKSYPAPPALAAPNVDAEGFMTLSPDAFKKFGSDLPVKDALVAAAVQKPISAAAFGAQVTNVAWQTKPTWYIVSTLDQAIAPDEERFFAKRMKATTTELKASHVSMLSQPKAVAAVIMDAAEKSGVSNQAEAH
jgi:pimeloyl-ACP methyl ester carboxylesterase